MSTTLAAAEAAAAAARDARAETHDALALERQRAKQAENCVAALQDQASQSHNP